VGNARKLCAFDPEDGGRITNEPTKVVEKVLKSFQLVDISDGTYDRLKKVG
jgi:hypothetical protein